MYPGQLFGSEELWPILPNPDPDFNGLEAPANHTLADIKASDKADPGNSNVNSYLLFCRMSVSF